MYIYRHCCLLQSTAGAKGSIDEATEDESGRGRWSKGNGGSTDGGASSSGAEQVYTYIALYIYIEREGYTDKYR